jgi:hypothetical protein
MSANLEKPDGLIYQTETSSFGRTKIILVEEDDCSKWGFEDGNDDDDSNDEYDDQELLL